MCYGYKQSRWFFWGAPLVLLFFALGSLLVMLLWNSLLPDIFGLKTITYLQAAGLLILAKILFGGFNRRQRYFYGHYRPFAKKAESEPATSSGENTKN
jgi:hypothetical protein